MTVSHDRSVLSFLSSIKTEGELRIKHRIPIFGIGGRAASKHLIHDPLPVVTASLNFGQKALIFLPGPCAMIQTGAEKVQPPFRTFCNLPLACFTSIWI